MIPRLLALGAGVLLIAACQSAPSSMSIYAEVPRQCTCRDGEPLARVATDLEDAHLPVDFKVEQATEGLQRFSVTFDPARVSSDRVRSVIQNAGALIVPAP